MKLILFTILFLINTQYFINSEDKLFKDQIFTAHTIVKKIHIGNYFNEDTKLIKYHVNATVELKAIIDAFSYLQSKTCLFFSAITQKVTSEAFLIREGQDCGADLIEENNQLYFGIFLNRYCMSVTFIAKITLKALIMKSNLVKLIKENKGNNQNDGNVQNNGIYQNNENYQNYGNDENDQNNAANHETISELIISSGKRCKYEPVTNTLLIYTNSLHSPSDHKDYNFFLKSRQIRNIFEKITYEDLKYFFENFCKDSCIGKKSNCKNGGFLNPSNCYSCLCSMSWTGPLCNDFTARALNIANYILHATTATKTAYLKCGQHCQFKIEGPRNTRIRLRIQLEKHTYIKCSLSSPLEIRWNNGKKEERVYPCGSFHEFSVFIEKNYVLLFIGKQRETEGLQIDYQAINL